MAKLMVMIDIPEMSHDELLAELKNKDSDWWDDDNPGLVVVDEMRMTKSKYDDSFYVFALIGVRP